MGYWFSRAVLHPATAVIGIIVSDLDQENLAAGLTNAAIG